MTVAGCSDAPAPAEGALGSLDMAVQTTGPDGATYRITDQTLFTVRNADYSFYDRLRVEGTQPLQSFSLPPDAYWADITSLRSDGSFELERSDGTQTQLVSARYVGVSPNPFSITARSTTALTLPFRVADIGDVTFDVGQLIVNVDVDIENTSPTTGQLSMQGAAVDEQTFAGELESVTDYALPSNASVDQTWAWQITGPFSLRGVGRVCAPIEITTATSNQPAWLDLTQIVSGSAGTLCVTDGVYGDTVSVAVRRFADLTGTNLGTHLTGSSYEVLSDLTAYLPGTVLEGETLHLDQLVDAMSQGDAYAYYWLVENGSTQAHLTSRGPGHLQSGVN